MASEHKEAPKDIQEFIFKTEKGYLTVFVALIIGTILTVAASYIELGGVGNMVLGLLIAFTKASLVLLYFMHLISEKQLIYLVMGFTVFFCIGLMFLTIWAMLDFPDPSKTLPIIM